MPGWDQRRPGELFAVRQNRRFSGFLSRGNWQRVNGCPHKRCIFWKHLRQKSNNPSELVHKYIPSLSKLGSISQYLIIVNLSLHLIINTLKKMPTPNPSKFSSNKSAKNVGLRLWGHCHVWKHLSHEISHRFRLSNHKIVQISQEWPKFLRPPSAGAPACGFRGWSSSASQGDHPLLWKGWVARGFLSWSLPSSDWKMRWSNSDGFSEIGLVQSGSGNQKSFTTGVGFLIHMDRAETTCSFRQRPAHTGLVDLH